MKALVTGATGFVGSAMMRAAGNMGLSAHGISRADTDYSPSSLAALVNSIAPEFLFHAAGSASVRASVENPSTDFSASVDLFERVLEGVRRSSHRPRIIFPSSAAVYGNAPIQPIREDCAIAPISPYGYHKLACEILAREYATCFDVPVLITRIFSLFGEGQRRLLLWEVYRQFTESCEVTLAGTGLEERDYLHVDDYAAMAWRCAEAVRDPCVTINLASGFSLTVRDLAHRVGKLMGSRIPVRCLGGHRVGDPTIWRADIGLLRSLDPSTQALGVDVRLREVIAAWQQ